MAQIFSNPITEIIAQRYSCRSYIATPIEPETRLRLAEYARELRDQADGSQARFELVAANKADLRELDRLSTYGFIRGASGFLIGAAPQEDPALEKFGFLMEKWVLFATDLGLGTCWLGGTFTRSNFARKINLEDGEIIPAVIASGYPATNKRLFDKVVRRRAGSDRRLAWNKLFFKDEFGSPLRPEDAGDFALPLEMVRLAPSASNRQPWRILRIGQDWHFYLRRTPGYREGLLNRIFTQADLQRVDMGIAMCHFELTISELGLIGGWSHIDPGIEAPDDQTEYALSWVEEIH